MTEAAASFPTGGYILAGALILWAVVAVGVLAATALKRDRDG